jgi:putative ABC transport system permease protein
LALWDQFKWSVRHSRRQLLESMLVVMAIALGVGVIITVLAMFLSVGGQLRGNEQAEYFRTLEIMGKAEFSRRDGAPLVRLGSETERGGWSASLEELAELQEHLPANMYVYAENHWLAETPLLPEEETDEQSMAARFYGANRIFVTGTLPAYFAFSGAALKSGNFFVDDDVRNGNRVLIIPESLAEELFGQEDPLGKAVPLSDFGSEETLDYTVIGVLAAPDEKEGAMGTYQDPRQAYAPVAGSPYVSYDQGVMEFYNVYVGLEAGADLAAATEKVEGEARLIWGDQVAVRSALLEFRESQKQLQRYALLIGILASVGLVIAVINILNLMLARVLKRTKSIGLSMALGSSRQMVFRQFMLEAFTLGMIGSILGILLSFALVEVLKKALGAFFAANMLGTRVLLGFGLGFAVSLLFGVYPAYLGSRTNPVDALRTD